MPLKCLVDFSYRTKMRRFSLSQPISRTSILCRSCASLSNSTGRAARSAFSIGGIGGSIFMSRRCASIQSTRYARSSAATNSWPGADDLCVRLTVRWKWSGRTLLSPRKRVFITSREERPKAWLDVPAGRLINPIASIGAKSDTI